jgi:hypothetical protein
MASLQSLTVSQTGFLQLPVGTTAERPASPVTGQMRVNTTFTPPQLEIYSGSAWRDYKNRYTAGLGLSSAAPAASAQEILTCYPQAADGLYWITVSGTARQIWCDMKNGGWMFAGKMTSSSTFQYDAALWTDGNVTNATSSPTTASDIKSYAWFLPVTKARISLGFIYNYLEEDWESSTGLVGIFSTPAISTNNNFGDYYTGMRGTRYSRQKMEEWFNRSINVSGTGFGSYAGRAFQVGNGATWINCNMRGVNMLGNGGGAKVRYGVQLNNEGDCGSNDYFWGIGHSNALGAVGAGWRSNYNAGPYQQTSTSNGWIFVR